MNPVCRCPKCDAEIRIPDDARKGEIVSCPDCGQDFEIEFREANACRLKEAEKIGEDWGE